MLGVVSEAIQNKSKLMGLTAIALLVGAPSVSDYFDMPILRIDTQYPLTVGNIMEGVTWGFGVIIALNLVISAVMSLTKVYKKLTNKNKAPIIIVDDKKEAEDILK